MLHTLAPLRAAAVLLAAGLFACKDAGPRSTSVVLITVDTLRADQLGAYGKTPSPTPNLDRLAGESLVFERAYTQATLTHPALSSMLSGLLPSRHGVNAQNGQMRENVVALPLMLQAKEIATGSFVANMCKLQPYERTVFHDGWDVTFCGMDEEKDQYLWDTAVVDAGLEWIAEQRGPYLAWIHLMDPHAEHAPPPDLWDYEARPVREKFAQYRERRVGGIPRTRRT